MKKLPNLGRAVVPAPKIIEYLLSESHRDGRPKAVFFRRFGFAADAWEELAAALREHGVSHDVARIE